MKTPSNHALDLHRVFLKTQIISKRLDLRKDSFEIGADQASTRQKSVAVKTEPAGDMSRPNLKKRAVDEDEEMVAARAAEGLLQR